MIGLFNSLVVLVLSIFVVGLTGVSPRIMPLVHTDLATQKHINALELALDRLPNDFSTMLELALLYDRVAEYPWADQLLRQAEKNAEQDPSLRARLGLKYLEIGKNREALRVMGEALAYCQSKNPSPCNWGSRYKLNLFYELALQFQTKSISAKSDPKTALALLGDVIRTSNAGSSR